MASAANLTAACPTCGADVPMTITLVLAPLQVDGKQTVIATTGITGEAHFCPSAEPAPGE